MIRAIGAHGRFARYLAAGAMNTIATYLLLLVAMRWLHYAIAYTATYAIGVVLGYWLQTRYVFRVRMEWRTAARFPLIYVTQYALGLSLLWALVDVADVPRAYAALAVTAATVPTGYALSRWVLARRRATHARDGDVRAAP
jgi:putative flippase GtrA